MIIRKIRKNGIVNVKKLVKRAILIVIVVLFIKGISYILNIHATNTGISVSQIGQQVILQGRLSPDNNFPYYTHSIVDTTKNKVGLKSTSVNLNNYSGQVQIVGIVERFLKFTPIVEVTAIKLPSQKLIIKNNTYFFVDDFLSLNFSEQSQLSAIKSGSEITVLFDNKPVVSIERFSCGKILKGKTCSMLIDDYTKNGKDNFTSLRGYEFYKHNDTTWVVFEGDAYGYVFKNIDDNMMLNLSNMITLVNKDFVLKNKSAVIWSLCSSATDPMENMLTSQIKYGLDGDGLITLNITGRTRSDMNTTCSLVFDPWNQWAVKNTTASK